jgi:hypothetical protein
VAAKSTTALFGQRLDGDKMQRNNNNNNSNKMVSIDDKEMGGGKIARTKEGKDKYWPKMHILCKERKDIVLKLLKMVDECDCTSELKADNGDNPKGNKWNKLFDVCFGGGSEGRGLLAGFPPLPDASKLKLKVISIWEYLKKAASIGSELYELAKRQEEEYEKTKAADKAAADKAKEIQDKLQKDMNDFEAGVGAKPPGAKGIVGGGRRQQSTNLKTNQPASYAWSNKTTGEDKEEEVIDVDVDDEDGDDKPTKPKPKGKGKGKGKASAATVNANALEDIKDMKCIMKDAIKLVAGQCQNNNDDGNKKRKRLSLKLETLKKQIETYQLFPDDPLYVAMLNKTKRSYIDTANALNKLDDEDSNGDE